MGVGGGVYAAGSAKRAPAKMSAVCTGAAQTAALGATALHAAAGVPAHVGLLLRNSCALSVAPPAAGVNRAYCATVVSGHCAHAPDATAVYHGQLPLAAQPGDDAPNVATWYTGVPAGASAQDASTILAQPPGYSSLQAVLTAAVNSVLVAQVGGAASVADGEKTRTVAVPRAASHASTAAPLELNVWQ